MDMLIILIIILLILFVLGIGAILIIILTKLPKETILNQQITDLKNELENVKAKQLEVSNKSLENQNKFYIESQRMLGDVHNKLGAIEETSKHIQEIGKDITSLQNILQAPKPRGNLGEYLLKELLNQILPKKHFEMKYSFRNGTQVDAIIKLGNGIIPVDSKFPLESFQRLIEANEGDIKGRSKREFITNIKNKINEIADKYINPDEGTFDFAMMYIPAENVFYEIIITDNLTDKKYEIFNYALSKHVIPVSPNSLYSYLMAIVFGLKGLQIEQQAKIIMGELSKVQINFGKFYSDFTVIGTHLKNATSKYEDSLKKAEKFNDQIGKITGIKTELIE